jgi:hypothetical protein
MKWCPPIVLIVLVCNAFANVTVSAPANNSTVSTTVQYVATASTNCSAGVAALGIYTGPGVLAYVVKGAKLNTLLNLNPGKYSTVVQEWDNCGGASNATVAITVGASSGGVLVAAPANNSSVSSTVQYVASATTPCSRGVAAMGIYTAPGVLAYAGPGANLNTLLNLAPGTHNTIVQEWDNCGGSAKTSVSITVGSSTRGANTMRNLQALGGWTGYALLPRSYAICNSCSPTGPEATWTMTQGIGSPSLSGNAARMNIGGQTRYADILWNNHLIGDFSSQGLPDKNRTIAPAIHNFIYDVYFYTTNLGASQAIEFDINQFVQGLSFIWGHECRIAGGHEWDIWDNQGQKWIPTGIPCNPVNNGWNHLVIKAQRTSDNHLLFQSITLNGLVSSLNHYESPTSTNWYGITINYQQDGNYWQQPYSVWLDRLNFSYW